MSRRSFPLRSLALGTSLVYAAAASQAHATDNQTGTGQTAANAASPEVNGGEIVVSARRRDERAQDVPISLSVVGSATLDRTSYSNLTQIADLTPSLNIRNANARNTFANIRGLGSNSTQNDGLEIGVGVYIDDVYYGRIGSSQFDLTDLERLEVLRGPQGTLFGKNTTAGAINITTREPSFSPEMRGEVSIGENGYRQFRASGSAPLIEDRLALRLTASHTEADGTLRNAYDGKSLGGYNNDSIRAQLLFVPTDRFKLKIIGDYSEQTASRASSMVGAVTRYDDGTAISNNILDRMTRLGYAPPFSITDPFARIVSVNAPVSSSMKGYGVSAKGDLDLGGATLTSITAYRWWDWHPQNDTDGTSLDINPKGGTSNRQRQFSQEVRLASSGTRTIDYVVGAYYFWQVIDALSQYRLGSDYAAWNNPSANQTIANYAYTGFQANSAARPETRSYALFGQATWHVTDALSLTGGMRFTKEDKQGTFDQYTAAGNDLSVLSAADRTTAQALRDAIYPTTSFATSVHDNALTGQINLSYKLAPDILAYASYARGSKSGGLNLGQLPSGVSPVIRPETVDAYEAGLKSQFWDRKVTANVAAFWTDVSNYQAAIAETIGTTTSVRRYISNIPGVRSRGFEADLSVRPSRYVTLSSSFAYTDTVYREYTNAQAAAENRNVSLIQDLSGTQLPNVPKLTYALAADLSYPVHFAGDSELYARADFNHRSSFSTDDTASRYSRIGGYGVLNVRIGVRFEDGRWDLSAWARNLLDKHYFTSLTTATTGLISGTIGDPQQFGATLRFRFQ